MAAGRPKGLAKTGGRKKGTPNRSTNETRELLYNSLSGEIDNIPSLLAEIVDPEKRLNTLSKFLPYILPKIQTVTISDITDLEAFLRLTDDEKKEMIEELTTKIKKGK